MYSFRFFFNRQTATICIEYGADVRPVVGQPILIFLLYLANDFNNVTFSYVFSSKPQYSYGQKVVETLPIGRHESVIYQYRKQKFSLLVPQPMYMLTLKIKGCPYNSAVFHLNS